MSQTTKTPISQDLKSLISRIKYEKKWISFFFFIFFQRVLVYHINFVRLKIPLKMLLDLFLSETFLGKKKIDFFHYFSNIISHIEDLEFCEIEIWDTRYEYDFDIFHILWKAFVELNWNKRTSHILTYSTGARWVNNCHTFYTIRSEWMVSVQFHMDLNYLI